MDVSCPSCAARYVADDEKLRGKTARMRCKACDTVWMVSGAPATSPPPAAEPKRAAVVKKGAERERRDLFAVTGEADLGSVKQSYSPRPARAGLGFSGVGARNESSVLFRVDQLQGSPRVKTPAPESVAELPPMSGSSSRSPAPSRGDDEGIIDLKALSSVPPRAAGGPVAPLFSEPPPVAVDVASAAAPLSLQGFAKTKKPIFIAAASAAAFLLVAGFGLSFIFKGEEPVARTNAIMAPPPAETAPPVVTPPPAPAVASETSATAETETPKEPKSKRGKGGKAKAGRNVTATVKAPAATPKPVKAANPCGCNGDFNCILACTAKRR